ncbi:MAG: hypothetical protein ACUVXA_00115 [Candidatus Jordarchaeum sp.]
MVSASETSMADIVKYCYQCGKSAGAKSPYAANASVSAQYQP